MSETRDIPGLDGYYARSDGAILTIWQKRKRYDSNSPAVRLGSLRLMDVELTSSGYHAVTIKRRRYVHRLVLEAFAGPCPKGMECRHMDGNKTNNSAANLAWDTHVNNMADRKRHGTNRGGVMFGEANGAASLSQEDVRQIRKMRREGHAQRALARRFGVSRTQIRRIERKLSWKHIA